MAYARGFDVLSKRRSVHGSAMGSQVFLATPGRFPEQNAQFPRFTAIAKAVPKLYHQV